MQSTVLYCFPLLTSASQAGRPHSLSAEILLPPSWCFTHSPAPPGRLVSLPPSLDRPSHFTGLRQGGIDPVSLSEPVAKQDLGPCSQPHSGPPLPGITPPPPSAWPWAPSTPRPISSTSFLVRAGPSKVSPGSSSSLQGARDIGGRHGSGRTKSWLFNHAVQTGLRPQAGGEGSLPRLPGRCPDFRSFRWPLGKERNKQVIRHEGQKHSR